MTHHITIDTSDPTEAPRLALVCTATPGSPCRKRPTDGRETWQFDDTDLVDGDCWAAEWVDAAGWDDSVRADGDPALWPRIPVTVHYDEGVVVSPVAPAAVLPDQTPDLDELRNYSKRARAASVFVDPPGALTDALDKLDHLIEHAARLDGKARRFANMLANRSNALNDAMPDVIRAQRAVAWAEGHAAPATAPNPYTDGEAG